MRCRVLTGVKFNFQPSILLGLKLSLYQNDSQEPLSVSPERLLHKFYVHLFGDGCNSSDSYCVIRSLEEV